MSKLQIPMIERLKSIPEIFGIRVNEEPEYEVLLDDGDYQIRRYGRQTFASVTMTASNEEDFKNKAFETLAKYIFGGNSRKANMAMTAPVHIAKDGKNIPMTAPVLKSKKARNKWTMSFILPADITLANAPSPLNSKVKLHEVSACDVAVVRYSGNNTEEKEMRFKNKLLAWLSKRPQYKVIDKAVSAQYDAPFVIPFFKRNEVQMKVTSVQ